MTWPACTWISQRVCPLPPQLGSAGSKSYSENDPTTKVVSAAHWLGEMGAPSQKANRDPAVAMFVVVFT